MENSKQFRRIVITKLSSAIVTENIQGMYWSTDN